MWEYKSLYPPKRLSSPLRILKAEEPILENICTMAYQPPSTATTPQFYLLAGQRGGSTRSSWPVDGGAGRRCGLLLPGWCRRDPGRTAAAHGTIGRSCASSDGSVVELGGQHGFSPTAIQLPVSLFCHFGRSKKSDVLDPGIRQEISHFVRNDNLFKFIEECEQTFTLSCHPLAGPCQLFRRNCI